MAGVAENFQASSTLLKIGTILIVFAFISHVVGFSIPHWMKPSSEDLQGSMSILDDIVAKGHTGLWTVCSCVNFFGREQCGCIAWLFVPGKFKFFLSKLSYDCQVSGCKYVYKIQ